MKSWPTRCDTDIAATVRSTQFVGGFVAGGGADDFVVAVRDAGVDAPAEAVVVGALPVTEDGADDVAELPPCPLEQAATVTISPSPSARPAPRRPRRAPRVVGGQRRRWGAGARGNLSAQRSGEKRNDFTHLSAHL
jgi:hypothetical protein